jgi:D-alanyl-D-alanine carboxypeptidase
MLRTAALWFLVVALVRGQDIPANADALVNAYVKLNRFMGSALVAKGGTVLVKKGYGMANVELDVPNSPETKFRLGSITKQFTATSILQIASQGKLSVEDKVSKYVPDAPAAWKDITIHHLLTHTSGLPNYTSFPDYLKKMREPVTSLQLIAVFKDRPLDFEPGSKFRYSNSGYAALGYIIEKVSGEKYEDYLRKHIFDPLDMSDTGYDHDTTILKQRAAGYMLSKDGKIRNADYLDMSIPYSAGSMYSTLEDLYRWDRSLYTDKVLPREWREKMFTPFLNNYAYGWFRAPLFGHKMTSHGGGINGFSTAINRFPDDDVCIVVLSNLASSSIGALANALAAIVFGEKYELPVERKEISLDPKLLDRYTGKYQLPDSVFYVAREGNQLLAGPNNDKAPIFPASATRFFLKVLPAEIEFKLDASGKVTGMVLHQGGQQMRGKRIE